MRLRTPRLCSDGKRTANGRASVSVTARSPIFGSGDVGCLSLRDLCWRETQVGRCTTLVGSGLVGRVTLRICTIFYGYTNSSELHCGFMIILVWDGTDL